MDEILTRAPTSQEETEAQTEAYYWYILGEFLAINKVFGQVKVLGDLKALRESVEPKEKEEKSRIHLISSC